MIVGGIDGAGGITDSVEVYDPVKDRWESAGLLAAPVYWPLATVLDDGRVLGTFPEGTRSPTGALQVAREGVTLLALRTGAPILPIACIDTDLFWPRGRTIWRIGGRIGMQVGEPFVVERRTGADGRKESLEDVTTRLMLHIAALLPPRQQGVYGPLLGVDGSPAGVSEGRVR